MHLSKPQYSREWCASHVIGLSSILCTGGVWRVGRPLQSGTGAIAESQCPPQSVAGVSFVPDTCGGVWRSHCSKEGSFPLCSPLLQLLVGASSEFCFPPGGCSHRLKGFLPSFGSPLSLLTSSLEGTHWE